MRVAPVAVCGGRRCGGGVVVDEGDGDVHQQYREGDGVRVAAPGADGVEEDADAGTVPELALVGGGGGNGIGGDEEGAEHGGAGEQMHLDRHGLVGVVAEEQGHQGQGAEEADGDVPGDDFQADQEETAREEAQVDPFPATGDAVAEDGVRGNGAGQS